MSVVIVGAGPIGLATAIRAQLTGLEPLVLDQRTPPLDKACGEGLMPGGVAELHDMGVELDPDGVSPFTGIRWIDGPRVAEADFPHGRGLGVRRLHLHRGILERASELGIEIRWGTRVTGLSDRGIQTGDGPIDAEYVVGADGLHSTVRKLAGLAGGAAPRKRFGIRRHYALAPWTDKVEVYWADGCEAYVTPVGPNRVGVAFLWSGFKSRFDDLLGRFPELAARLEDAPVDSSDRGSGPLHQRLHGVTTDRVLLVGDAAGYLDAITGEGLSLGFHQSRAAVDAMVQGELHRYSRAHARICRIPFALIRLMLFMEARPWLRRRVIAALSREPAIFGTLLAANDGAARPWSIGPGGAARLTVGIVRG